MKKIDISTKKYPNTFSLIDDEDYEFLMQWKWTKSTKGYAYRKQYGNKNLMMHRVIKECPLGFQIDHINKNKLDNRKINLRIVTNQQNHFNMNLQVNNLTGHTGVYFAKDRDRYRAQITFNRKSIHLGTFMKLEDAVSARKRAEETYFII